MDVFLAYQILEKTHVIIFVILQVTLLTREWLRMRGQLVLEEVKKLLKGRIVTPSQVSGIEGLVIAEHSRSDMSGT